MAGYNYRGSRSNGSPETPGIKANEGNPEMGVPLFSFVSTHAPYFYPDVQNQQQEKSLPQLYPYLPMDDSSVFPVFPVEMEPQGGGFDMGGSCSNNSTFGFNYFDPFQVELGTIEEGLVQGTIGAAAAAAAASSSSSLPVVERPPRLMVERWSPLIAKAARSKRRIVRQMSGGPRSYSLHHRSSASDSVSSAPSTRSSKKKNDSASATSASSSSSSPSQAADDLISHPLSENNQKLRLVLKKELKNSDVSSLGRIVLPKREAELNLPCLTAKEGVHLLIRDMISPRLWSMRYRYWPNNKSKMYVLENTGDFVRKHGLRVGDFIVLYKDEDNQLFISATKVERTTAAAPNTEQTMEDDKEKTLEENGDMKLAMACSATEESSIGGGRVSTQLALAVAEPSSTKLLTPEEEAAFSLDPSAVGLNDCVFSHLERLPGFEDCDLSLYDDLMDEEEKPFRWR